LTDVTIFTYTLKMTSNDPAVACFDAVLLPCQQFHGGIQEIQGKTKGLRKSGMGLKPGMFRI
jgi:hypothetical protein